jgi:hypothetical protein
MSSTRKIDSILDKLEKSAHLTPDGRNWLVSAIDPFHDSDINLAGYPDVLSAATIVQLVKQQIQLAVPTSGSGIVTANANWDCSIALTPCCLPTTIAAQFAVSPTGLLTGPTTVTGCNYGGLVAMAGPQGQRLWPDATGGAVNASGTYLNPSAYVKGQGRVIGMGFEVVNTTSELNKQGQVTAWRMPSLWTETMGYSADSAFPVYGGTGTYKLGRLPPSTIANAQLLFGSRSWAAKEGAYIVARQNTTANPAMLPSFQNIAFSALDNQALFADSWYSGTFPVQQPGYYADWYLPFDTSGVHFTGLSYTTTLTVNVRWLIERIPGPNEADLVVLATPSASYDSLALELYTRCVNDMPPGVMLSENPLGEWFRDALSKVSDWAPKVGNALGTFIPGASIIGNGVGMAAGAAKKMIKKTKNGVEVVKKAHRIPLQGSASTTKLLTQ